MFMAPHLRVPAALAAALVLLVSLPQGAAAQSFKWWQNERFQRELALSAEQITRLEDIYQGAGPAMRSQKATLERLQGDLSKLVSDGRADEATADELITKVETHARRDALPHAPHPHLRSKRQTQGALRGTRT